MEHETTEENIDTIISLYHVNYYKNIFTDGNPNFLKTQIDKEIGLVDVPSAVEKVKRLLNDKTLYLER